MVPDVPATQEVLDAFARSPLLRLLDASELRRFVAFLDRVELPADAVVVREGDTGREMYFIVSGEAQVSRGPVTLRPMKPGAEFGSLGLLTGLPRAATVTAVSPLTLARLTLEQWTAFGAREGALAFRILQGLFHQVREDLTRLTDSVGALQLGRSLPRSAEVTLTIDGVARQVRTGTMLRELLPAELDGHLVVGALLGQKPVSLATPVMSSGPVSCLTIGDWEGRQIYARSVALLLLEAAHQVDPALQVRLGPSRGPAQIVELPGVQASDLPALARRILAEMNRIAAAKVAIRREQWAVDEAMAHFAAEGWEDAARLLRTSRQSSVSLVSCGKVYALSLGPALPDTSELTGFSLSPHDEGLLLNLGGRDVRVLGTDNGGELPPRDVGMVAEHRRWLAAMGLTSVGGFNDLCVSGQVVQLLRVAEGFHEKQIGRIADTIAAARDRLRIIAIAGPSSSGKTTFIRRLTVQLQITGLNPIGLSLDDYYVDREKTVKDERGEYDFEALEALDLELLQDHVRRLLDGEAVKLARYDFKTGRSNPTGGPTLQLRPGDLLMMEGIHGLNPRLLGAIPQPGQSFGIFVHPATTLPFDRLSRVSATDLRLLRRIIRDRHVRGYSAAQNIARWPSVLAGERKHIFPHHAQADVVFDTALIYEPSILKVYAERYLLEVPTDHPSYATAYRLRHLVDRFVAVYPDHVPPTSIIREFIGGSGFEY